MILLQIVYVKVDPVKWLVFIKLKHKSDTPSQTNREKILGRCCNGATVCETLGLGWCCPRRRCGPPSELAHTPTRSSARSRACPDADGSGNKF